MSQDFGAPTPITSMEQPKKSNSTTIIIIVVVVVLLCCCCGFLISGYFLWDPIMNAINGVSSLFHPALLI